VSVRGTDREEVARLKGDEVMRKVLAKAVRDRKRPLPRTLRLPHGLQNLVLDVHESAEIVRDARRRFRTHNAGRRFVEREVARVLAESSRTPIDPTELWRQVRRHPMVVEALERMWPVLTPAQLLHDLFGSRALLRLAGKRALSPQQLDGLHRPRAGLVHDVVWTHDDVPLLDEAYALLGPKPRRRKRDSDETRT